MKSFLFSGLLGVLLALSGWGFIGSLFFSGFSLGFESGFFLLHDLFVLLDGFGIHLNGGVAQSAVISIPVLSHEDSWTA